MAGSEGPGKVSLDDLAESAYHAGTVPVVLKVAQTFLVLICALYLTKMAVLVMGLHEGYGDPLMSLATFVIDIVMLFVTVDSLLSVSSRKPKAWKKVARAGMLLVIFNLIAWFGTDAMTASSLVSFNPMVVTPLAVIVILIMYWRPIRRYYTPLSEEVLPIGKWFLFSLFSPLYTSAEYRITYDDDRR